MRFDLSSKAADVTEAVHTNSLFGVGGEAGNKFSRKHMIAYIYSTNTRTVSGPPSVNLNNCASFSSGDGTARCGEPNARGKLPTVRD